MAGYTVEEIGEMSLWQFNQVKDGFIQFNSSSEQKPKAPTIKDMEEAYKESGVWYPEIMEDKRMSAEEEAELNLLIADEMKRAKALNQ